MWSVLFICKNIRGSLRGRKFGQTYKVGDTFTLKELLGKEDIKYRAFTRALGVMRDNGEIDIVKPGVYKIKAFAVEYF